MSSPRTSEDANTVFHSHVPLLSDLQKDVRHSEGGGPLRASSNTSELADRGDTVTDLPDELMLEIFSYMSSNENINILQKVCHRWKILAQAAKLWYHWKYVVRETTSEEEAIATFASVPQLRTVILCKGVSPGVFEALRRCCSHLTTLEMSCEQELSYSDAVSLFDGCNQIRTLTISYKGQQADSRLTEAVAHLADLRELRLRYSGFEDLEIPLHILAEGCPHLCHLDMGSLFYKIQDAEYFIRSKKHVLKCMIIRWTSVEWRSIALLLPTCAETLERLVLWDYKVSEEEAAGSFAALGQLRNLQQLRFGLLQPDDRHLVSTVFENGGFPKLQQLDLYGAVMDEVMRAVSEHCPELRDLTLTNCDFHSDALYKSLLRLEKLEKLKIHSCYCMREKAMSYIAKLPSLHTLHLRYIDFRHIQSSVNYILEMSGLRRLILEEIVYREIPFDEFPGRLVNLRELEINRCIGDEKALDKIHTEMPGVRVKVCVGGHHVQLDEDFM